MFTQDQADYLLALPKELANIPLIVDLSLPKTRFEMSSPDDDQWNFMIDITNSVKKSFKISLHHLETQAKEGLLRVDFNGSHRNPETASEKVPKLCIPYVGRWFQNEPHVHIFVEGYRDLAWALPLTNYDGFDVKDVTSVSDFAEAIRSFCKRVNLRTNFEIQEAII